MTVLLPRHGVSVDDLATSPRRSGMEGDLPRASAKTEMLLFLPRFRMAYERTLNDDLAALGMVDAFDHRADFTRLSPVDGLSISEVKQKSWVDVNEEGTEAAAATVVAVRETSASVFRADRPFPLLSSASASPAPSSSSANSQTLRRG